MNVPEDLKYTNEHEWIKVLEDDLALIGITDFAQAELGELVYIEVETVSETIERDEVFGTVEAVKTTSDLFMPVSGEILEFNEELDEKSGDNPGVINEDPYEKGWIIKIRMTEPSQIEELISSEEYKELIS